MVIPGTGRLRLRWAEATLDSIQLSEPRWLPGAIDPRLTLSAESSETVLGSEPSNVESVDLLSGVELELSDRESVDLVLGVEPEPSPEGSVDLVLGVEPEPSPNASLGLQSSGSYLLCFRPLEHLLHFVSIAVISKY